MKDRPKINGTEVLNIIFEEIETDLILYSDKLDLNYGVIEKQLWDALLSTKEWKIEQILDKVSWNYDCIHDLDKIIKKVTELQQTTYKDVLADWIEQNDLRPLYEIGDEIQLKLKHLYGTILSIDDETAHYRVHVPVIAEQQSARVRYSYTMVPFENVVGLRQKKGLAA